MEDMIHFIGSYVPELLASSEKVANLPLSDDITSHSMPILVNKLLQNVIEWFLSKRKFEVCILLEYI